MHSSLYFDASVPACLCCGDDAELDSELCAGCNEEQKATKLAHERRVRKALDDWQLASVNRSLFRRADDRGWTIRLLDYEANVDIEVTEKSEIDAIANALQAAIAKVAA